MSHAACLPRLTAATIATLLLAAPALAAPTLEEVLSAMDAGPNALERLRAGEIISKELEASADTELGVTLAMLVRRPPAAVAAFASSDRFFEVDREVIASGVVDPKTPEAGLTGAKLTASDAKEIRNLLEAAPGKKLNLSKADRDTLAAARAALGGSSAHADPRAASEVSKAMQAILARRLAAYRDKGLAGIEPYDREDGTSSPADQLRRAQQASAALKRHAPALDAALTEFPGGSSASATQQWRWLKIRAQDRPAFALSHRMRIQESGVTLAAERQFYVGHSYGASLILAGLFEVKEGTVVVYMSRLHTDEVAGGMGGMKRNIGRGMMAKSLRQLFEDQRKAIESTK